MSEKRSFFRLVKSQIKSKEARRFVELELNTHIEDTVLRLTKSGLSRETAESKAVQQMGDPIKIGLKMGRLHQPKIDWSLLGLFIFLHLIGLLPLLITNFDYHPPLFRKIMDIFFGIVCVYSIMLFDYRKLKEKMWLFLGIAGIILLLFFHFGIFGIMINGNLYVYFGPFKADSMIVMPLLFLGLAGVFYKYAHRHLLIIGVFSLSLLIYMPVSNSSNILIYISMFFAMYVWSIRKHKKQVLGLFGALFVMVGGLLFVFSKFANEYMKHRLLGFFYPETYGSSYGYMNMQFKKYLSESIWFGKPRLVDGSFIPDPHTDYVFVTLTYSFGWLFSIGLAIFLTAITVRMCWISRKTPDKFGQLIIIGATALYTIPFVYNIAMVLGWLPIASISLPFISYGTMHILINAVLIGLVLSVYRRKDLITLAEINNPRSTNMFTTFFTYVKQKKKRLIWIAVLCSFIIYLSNVLRLTIGTPIWPPYQDTVIDIQITPFFFIKDWIMTYQQNGFDWFFWNSVKLTFYNLIMLAPFGTYLAVLFNIKSIKKAALIIFLTSLTIETYQLIFTYFGIVIRRTFNVDDLMLNTLGGCIGFGLGWLAKKGYVKVKKKLLTLN